MRTFEVSVGLTAAAPAAWSLMSDVCRWPEWMPTVQQVRPLGSPGLALGARFEVRQPRLRPAVWQVTQIEPGRSFAWQTRSIGLTTRAEHVIALAEPGQVTARLRIVFSGWMAGVAAWLFGRLTREYLQRELDALVRQVSR